MVFGGVLPNMTSRYTAFVVVTYSASLPGPGAFRRPSTCSSSSMGCGRKCHPIVCRNAAASAPPPAPGRSGRRCLGPPLHRAAGLHRGEALFLERQIRVGMLHQQPRRMGAVRADLRFPGQPLWARIACNRTRWARSSFSPRERRVRAAVLSGPFAPWERVGAVALSGPLALWERARVGPSDRFPFPSLTAALSQFRQKRLTRRWSASCMANNSWRNAAP